MVWTISFPRQEPLPKCWLACIKINQHEIDGSHLLDHRNYLDVKTLIQRRGAEQFEPLNASSLSTGERIGSGLAVLIAVLRHWGRKPWQ